MRRGGRGSSARGRPAEGEGGDVSGILAIGLVLGEGRRYF